MSFLNTSCALQVAFVFIGLSISSALFVNNTWTVQVTVSWVFNRTTSKGVSGASSGTFTSTVISVIKTVSSANWVSRKISTHCARLRGLSSFLSNRAFTKMLERTIIALKLTKISVSLKFVSVLSTSRHENIRAKLTLLFSSSSYKSRAFADSKLENSDSVHGACVIVGKSVNTANRSVFSWAVVSNSTRSSSFMDLLGTVQNTLVFISESSKRANWFERSSKTVTLDRFFGSKKFKDSVRSFNSAWTFVSKIYVVVFLCTSVHVGYVILTANRHENLWTIGLKNFFLDSGFFVYHNGFNFGARSLMFNLDVCSSDSASIFVSTVIDSA